MAVLPAELMIIQRENVFLVEIVSDYQSKNGEKG